MANVKPIPEGYHSVTPYLYIKGAAGAIDYYKNVFGAKEHVSMPGPNGRIMHAELQIGDSMIMLADENLQIDAKSPATLGGVASSLLLYVENVDAVTQKAVAAGAKLVRPVQDQFLRRSQRHHQRSIRPFVVDSHAHRRCVPRGNEEAHGQSHRPSRRRLIPSRFAMFILVVVPPERDRASKVLILRREPY